jgi:hypothetical protein
LSEPKDAGTTLRVQRGQPTEEELAAVALSLMTQLARRKAREQPPRRRCLARWHRWDRDAGYRSPGSWR